MKNGAGGGAVDCAAGGPAPCGVAMGVGSGADAAHPMRATCMSCSASSAFPAIPASVVAA
eukprot:11217176-Lingulodinium_polyedra.AAC.1